MPDWFGTGWGNGRAVRTVQGPRVLFESDVLSFQFIAARRAARDEMDALGFSLSGGWPVLWAPEGFDPADSEFNARVSGIEMDTADLAVAARAEHEVKIAADAAERAELLAEIKSIWTERPWAIHPTRIPHARRIAALETMPEDDLRIARDIVKAVKATVAKAEKALSQATTPTHYALAGRPEAREAALEGCRHMSAMDEDRAEIVNSWGWSKSTSAVGHLISERDELDQATAAHAIRLLEVHRRQVPEEILRRIGIL